MVDQEKLKLLSSLVRYFILLSTTAAGSGHPTSSLSATEVMTAMMFGGFFRADLKNPNYENNDRLIFSKGHASPLFYSLYAAAGEVTEEELKTLRKLGSKLEGHPTMRFPYTECATGSLGQGLSVGVGMALNAKYVDELPYRTFVLLGDSEMAEGSVWEAMNAAAHYKLNNLIGIIDANRLGQRGETMFGHDTDVFVRQAESFGWEAISIDGHDMSQVVSAFEKAMQATEKPVMIIAKTFKGKGVSFLEDKEAWHGKALKPAEFEQAVVELGEFDKSMRGEVASPEKKEPKSSPAGKVEPFSYDAATPVATRKAYGNALKRIFPAYPNIVVLDAEVSNSTYAEIFAGAHGGQHFFEMFIAEQNMAGAALGFSRRGKIPFVSTFAAFHSRAFDQIRMSQYSDANIKFVGSHAGVSIGEDGASQMGLEDISMFRTLLGSSVLYPSDAVSTEKLVEQMAKTKGTMYLRTTRKETPVIYSPDEEFVIGGSKVLRTSADDQVTIVAAGITLVEALEAYETLKKEGVTVRVIDLYSVKPIDTHTLEQAATQTKALVVVEDHFEEGGMGEAVRSALAHVGVKCYSLAVKKMPQSGKPEELLEYEDISAGAIVRFINTILA